jgi:mRNA interferase RelE/StbE
MSGKTYRLVLHREALNEIHALPKKIRLAVCDVIDGLALEPRPAGASQLKGRKGAYRLRIGDYRLLYEIHATEIIVYVIGVAHRREVYVRLLRRR